MHCECNHKVSKSHFSATLFAWICSVELNNSDDFFSGTVEGSEIKLYFDGLITDQVTNVYPNWNTNATAGTAGQLADGASTRYVNAKGYENDQLLKKKSLFLRELYLPGRFSFILHIYY